VSLATACPFSSNLSFVHTGTDELLGPGEYDVQPNNNRNRKYRRRHLLNVLKGPNK